MADKLFNVRGGKYNQPLLRLIMWKLAPSIKAESHCQFESGGVPSHAILDASHFIIHHRHIRPTYDGTNLTLFRFRKVK